MSLNKKIDHSKQSKWISPEVKIPVEAFKSIIFESSKLPKPERFTSRSQNKILRQWLQRTISCKTDKVAKLSPVI